MQSIENKLLLVQQIRDRHQENMLDMGRRERILYGQDPSPYEYGNPGRIRDEKESHIGSEGHFRLRLLLAVVLLGVVIYLDQKGIKMVGITSEKIFEVISTNVSIDWPAL